MRQRPPAGGPADHKVGGTRAGSRHPGACMPAVAAPRRQAPAGRRSGERGRTARPSSPHRRPARTSQAAAQIDTRVTWELRVHGWAVDGQSAGSGSLPRVSERAAPTTLGSSPGQTSTLSPPATDVSRQIVNGFRRRTKPVLYLHSGRTEPFRMGLHRHLRAGCGACRCP